VTYHSEKSVESPISQTATAADTSVAQIHAHIERHIGKIGRVFSDTEADDLRIDIYHVAPVESRNYHTLVTAGMSRRAMQVPAEMDAPQHLELMMTLPVSWKVGNEAQRWHWPILQLQYLARYPHDYRTWLGWGHAIPNGEPPRPFADNTQLCGATLVPSLLVPRAFYELVTSDRQIAFFSVVPLYREELELREREGMETLFTQLLEHDINDVVNPRRRNVCKRFFGLF
jgi:hypothetical protein